MRILRVAQKVYPDVPGGGPYHVHALSRDQAEMGHDVTVLTVTEDPEKPETELRSGYKVKRKKSNVQLLGNHISIGIAEFLRNADRFDLIHAHSHLYFSTNLAALKNLTGDVPLAITNHGLYSQSAPEYVFDVYLKTLGRWTFNRSDCVFCYTDEDRNRLKEFGVASDIEVVPNGVDQERFRPNGPGSSYIDYDGEVALFVGRLVEGKNPDDAVKAIAGLNRSRNRDVKLYICGKGPMRADLEKLASELDQEENIEFLGHVEYGKMPAIYRSADVLVLPSRAEGLPRTVLEAQASGTPVVSSDLEHISGVVEMAGETVEVGDIKGYFDVLSYVLDQGFDSMKNDEFSKVFDEKYSWSQTVEETTKRLEETVAR
ncbi:MAG: glycosyltransferase family 4 protein [Halobacteria archaeon]